VQCCGVDGFSHQDQHFGFNHPGQNGCADGSVNNEQQDRRQQPPENRLKAVEPGQIGQTKAIYTLLSCLFERQATLPDAPLAKADRAPDVGQNRWNDQRVSPKKQTQPNDHKDEEGDLQRDAGCSVHRLSVPIVGLPSDASTNVPPAPFVGPVSSLCYVNVTIVLRRLKKGWDRI
jgi:hypothetical protein